MPLALKRDATTNRDSMSPSVVTDPGIENKYMIA